MSKSPLFKKVDNVSQWDEDAYEIYSHKDFQSDVHMHFGHKPNIHETMKYLELRLKENRKQDLGVKSVKRP